MIERRKVLEGFIVTGSVGALALSLKVPGAKAKPINRVSGSYGNLPKPDRDQGMGATDASGFVTYFPLRAQGAKQVWVNTVTGSPSYNGLSPYPGYEMNGSGTHYQGGATGPGAPNAIFGPKDSYADAMNSVYPTVAGGEGNQFFFAEGQTFIIDKITYGTMYYHGIGASYPACFQSYDSSDPLNVAKHGRAGTGSQGARPIWKLGTGVWPNNGRGDAVDYGGWVFRGMQWLSAGNGQYMNWVYCQNNMLFEGMVFNNLELVLENVNPHAGFNTSKNNIVRFCASYGQYDTKGSHICGIYSENVNLTIEDCVFWHCGWKVGASRDAAASAGGPDIFKHCLYLHNGLGTTSLVRRNVLIDGSAAGLSLRGNHVCHHNVIIDCPTPDFKSGGSGSDTESPNGVSQHAYCQLMIGGADISTSNPRMQGFSSSDGKADSYLSYSLAVNNPGYGKVNNCWLSVQNNVTAQVSNMTFNHNRAYAYAPPARRLSMAAGTHGSLSSIKMTDNDNVVSASSPMTTAQMYAAIGYFSKQAMINDMIADPTAAWAYGLLAVAAAGFNFNFNYTMA